MKMFHGTTKTSAAAIRADKRRGLLPGSWVTTSREFAEHYAAVKALELGDEPEVMELEVDPDTLLPGGLQNPTAREFMVAAHQQTPVVKSNPSVEVEALHPGITELPAGAWSEWPVEKLAKHFGKLIAEGMEYREAVNALLNIERWNKNRLVGLSKKARSVLKRVQRAHASRKG